MGPSKFTNRRGHSLDVKDDQLDNLQIDDQPVMMPAAGGRRFKRRWLLIGLGCLLLVAAALIAAGELVAAQYRSAPEQIKQRVASIGQAGLERQQSTDLRAADIDQPLNQLRDLRDGLCRGGLWDNAAQLYPRAQAGYAGCVQAKEELVSLIQALESLQGQASYLEALDKALSPIGRDSDSGQFAVLSAQLANWQRAERNLSQLTAPQGWQGLHQQLSEQVESIKTDWSKLNTATNNTDGDQFRAAQDSLTKGYAGLRQLEQSIVDQVTKTQLQLSSAYQATQR